MSIPKIQRDAHDDTDCEINRLRGILCALDHLIDVAPLADDSAFPESDAVYVLIQEARAKINKIEELRRAEWAALKQVHHERAAPNSAEVAE